MRLITSLRYATCEVCMREWYVYKITYTISVELLMLFMTVVLTLGACTRVTVVILCVCVCFCPSVTELAATVTYLNYMMKIRCH